MDRLAREHDGATQRRWWGALLFVTLGLVLVVLLMRGAAGTQAAPGSVHGVDGLDQASPLAAGTEWLRVTANLSGAPHLLSVYPDVAVSGDGQYVAVVWQEQAAGDAEEQGVIYIRCAQEDTLWWGAKRPVPGSYATGPAGQRRGQMPAVALYGNQVHVVWSGGYEGNYNKIYYRWGTIDDSNLVVNWSSLQTVADVSGVTLVVPDIALDSSGQPHVVWQQENTAIKERHIYYSALSGSAWGSPEKVSRDADSQNQDPSIAVEGTTAHAAWVGGSITGTVSIAGGYVYHAVSDDSWATPAQVSWSFANWEPLHPSIAVLDGQVGIVWETWKDTLGSGQDQVGEEDRWTVYYAAQNGGWSPPGESFGDDFYPHIDGDEYVRSVRPSLAYVSDPVEPVPYVALSRTEKRGLSDPAITYYWEWTGDKWRPMRWSEEETTGIVPRGGSTGGERGAVRVAIGRYDGKDHVHFVFQTFFGVDDQGQNRWEVFYTSDELYKSIYLVKVTRNG